MSIVFSKIFLKNFNFLIDIRHILIYNINVANLIHTQGYSSVGRAVVSKTTCRGFKSYCPCKKETVPLGAVFLFAKQDLKPMRVFALRKSVRVTLFQQKGAQTGTEAAGLGGQAGQIAKQYEVLLPLLKSPRSIERGLLLFNYYLFTITLLKRGSNTRFEPVLHFLLIH